MYTLILIVVLAINGQLLPVMSQVEFDSKAACEKAADSAMLTTPIPYVDALAKCEKRTDA